MSNVCANDTYFLSFKLFLFCLCLWGQFCRLIGFVFVSFIVFWASVFCSLSPSFFMGGGGGGGGDEFIRPRLNIFSFLTVLYLLQMWLFWILLTVPPVTGCRSWWVCVQVLHAKGLKDGFHYSVVNPQLWKVTVYSTKCTWSTSVTPNLLQPVSLWDLMETRRSFHPTFLNRLLELLDILFRHLVFYDIYSWLKKSPLTERCTCGKFEWADVVFNSKQTKWLYK